MKSNFITTALLLAVGYTLCCSPAQAQTITTAAGDGTANIGTTGTGATNSIAVDAAGNLYVATGGLNTIRKITTTNVVSTYAGTGAAGFSGDNGQASAATFKNIQDLFISNGFLYVADGGNRRIRKINLTTNVITTVAGDGTTNVTGNGIGATSGVAVDHLGNIYVAGGGLNVIRKVTPGGVYSTYAGTGTAGFSGDNGAASAATFNLPSDLFIASNKLYIADVRNRRIRMIDLSTNNISTVAGDGTTNITGNGIGGTAGVVADGSGSIFVATGGAGNAVRKISGSTYTTVSGGNTTGAYTGDNGSGSAASLNLPVDLAFYNNNLYVADEKNRRIRGITLTTVPLEINLLTFIAAPAGNDVLLQWSVMEKNVSAYEIERSSDAISFTKTGSVVSRSGQESVQADYSFTDAKPLQGTSFYRLKIINRDGKFTYSNVEAIHFGSDGKIAMSPVPAHNFIHLSTSPTLLGSEAFITNMEGKQVLKLTVAGSQDIDISGFAAGVYCIKLVNGTLFKFIKN
jgi:hypothetical protein